MPTLHLVLRRTTGALLLAGAFGAAAPVLAQRAQFTSGQVAVVDARTAFVAPAHTGYALGERLVLAAGAAPQARALFDHGFRVRIFRVPAADRLPTPLQVFDPCEVYLSSVVRFRGSDAIEATVTRFNDPSWLALTEGRPAEPGQFLLVVETAGSDDPLLRLEARHRQAYFRSGLRFAVHPARPLSAEEVGAEMASLQHQLQQAIQQAHLNQPTIRCFRMEARASDREELLAYLQPPCAPEVAVDAQP